jgi:hypothetical protein
LNIQITSYSIKENLRRNYSDLANNFENDLNALSLTLGALDGDLDVRSFVLPAK